MSVFPITFEDKVDSPEFTAWLATFGAEKKMTAAEINLVRDALNELHTTKVPIVGGKIPSEYLPSYVDDVLEFENVGEFPATGETGKIYVDLEANSTYRWSGSVYVAFSTGKRKQVIEFSWNGGGYAQANGYWFALHSYFGKYNAAYSANLNLTPTNDFAYLNHSFGYKQKAWFNGKAKKAFVSIFCNGGQSFTLDVAIVNYKITPGSNFASWGPYGHKIIAREQFSITASQGIQKMMLSTNIDSSFQIVENSFFALVFNTGVGTDRPIQNPQMFIEIEED